MADGSITFNTKIDTSDIPKELKKVEREIDRSTKAIAKNTSAKMPLAEKAEKAEKALKAARKELESLKEETKGTQLLSDDDLTAKKAEYKKFISEMKSANKQATVALDGRKLAEETANSKKWELEEAKERLRQLQAEQTRFQQMQKGQVYSSPQEYVDAFAEQDRLAESIKAQSARVKELQKEWGKAADRVERYEKKYHDANEKAMSAAAGAGNLKPVIDANESIRQQETKVAKLQSQWEAAQSKVNVYNTRIQESQAAIDANKAKIDDLTVQMDSYGTKIAGAFAKAETSANKFSARLISVGKSVLVFSAIRSGLSAIVSYTNKMLQTNEQYTKQLAQLKGALLTAFQPLYQVVLPAATAILQVLTAIVSVVANVLSVLTGKTAAQSAENAKALNDEADAIGNVGSAAEKAKKSLAGFDEINTLGTPESSSSGGGASGIEADFSAFNTAEYKAKIDELTVYLSGALLALGAILTFSGANIPLGIGLMAAGAIGLAAVVKANWGAMSDDLKGSVGAVVTLLGGMLLALGAVLAFSGVKPVLGLALMAAGLTAYAVATALDWNNIKKALQGPVGEVVAIASGAVLALGLILAFSGVNLPLGIALIAAGAVGLVTVGAMNWDAIQQKLSQVWEGIKQWFNTHVKPKLTLEYWKEKFATIADALEQKIKDGVNAAIALVNKFITWLNEKMVLKWSDFSVGGVKVVEAGSFTLLNIPKIPALAQGAVLPANKPFLAMVGDQKNGTNVEAPLDTIKQALAEVMAQYGNGDVNVNISGDLAPFIRWLKVEIDRESKRVGPSLAGGNV